MSYRTNSTRGGRSQETRSYSQEPHLSRIVAPHFVAGITSIEGIVTEAAPIVRYMVGWRLIKAVRYCMAKRWECRAIDSVTDLQISKAERSVILKFYGE